MSVLDSKKVRECIGKVTVVSIDGYQRIENGAFIGSLLTSIGDSTFAESGLTTFSAPQGVLDNLGLSVGSRNVGGAANVSVF